MIHAALIASLWMLGSITPRQELPDSLAQKLQGLDAVERTAELLDFAERVEEQSSREGLRWILRALRTAPNDTLEIKARLLAAHTYRELGILDSCYAQAELALDLAQNIDNDRLAAEARYELGNYYLTRRITDTALEHYLAALRVIESEGDESREASMFNVIAQTYLHRSRATGDSLSLVLALDYFKRFQATVERIGERADLAGAYSNVGAVLRDLERFDESLDMHLRALAIREELGRTMDIAASLNNIGFVLGELGRYSEALDYLARALTLKREEGIRSAEASTLLNIAKIKQKQGRTTEALSAANQALVLSAQDSGTWGELHQILYTIHKSLGNAAAALEALEIYHRVDSTIASSKRQTNFAQLQALQVQRENDVLAQQKAQLEREAEIDRLRTFLLVAVLVGLGIVLSLLYSRYRLRMRSNAALTKALSDLEYSMMQLTETQDRLIYAEKMASLGQLTAGIAHEIKNPLNFINNFSDLSDEITSDLLERLEADPDARIADVAHDLQDLRSNAQQVAKHGHRADAIVRSMLEHSRTSPGEVQPVDLNALVDEYIKLAFHGARASNPGLQVELETRLDPLLETVNCIPQDIGRVLINLLTNAFYAVDHQSRLADCPPEYGPHVRVFTRKDGAYAEIVVADNGYGIPKDVQARIFEPFFTTKPTGTGTGLGLSLSFDIITRGHGGDMTVHSVEGEGATFTVRLPLRRESDMIWEESIETSTEPESA